MAKEDLDTLWSSWKKDPTPERFDSLFNASKPVIDKAITSYARGNKVLMGKAKVLASGAIKSYEPSFGTKLQTHLMTQLQPLIRASRESESTVRMPERIYSDLYHIKQESQKFIDEHGRDPSDIELSGRLGISTKRLSYIRKFGKSEVSESSLKSPSGEGEQEMIQPAVNIVSPKQIWTEYVHHDLPPMDQKILEWRTGFGGNEILSTNEIAKRLKITPSAVSQRAAKIAKTLAEGQNMDLV